MKYAPNQHIFHSPRHPVALTPRHASRRRGSVIVLVSRQVLGPAGRHRHRVAIVSARTERCQSCQRFRHGHQS